MSFMTNHVARFIAWITESPLERSLREDLRIMTEMANRPNRIEPIQRVELTSPPPEGSVVRVTIMEPNGNVTEQQLGADYVVVRRDNEDSLVRLPEGGTASSLPQGGTGESTPDVTREAFIDANRGRGSLEALADINDRINSLERRLAEYKSEAEYWREQQHPLKRALPLVKRDGGIPNGDGRKSDGDDVQPSI